jgi:hypothetical protein
VKTNKSCSINSNLFLSIFLLFLISLSTFAFPADSTYSQSGGTVTFSNRHFTSSVTDVSGVLISNSGILNLSNSFVTTSGNSSNTGSSSQYGLNAGVLSESGSTISMSACSVATTGSGANGLFATGTNSSITLTDGNIYCTGGNAHGVDVTYTGSITLKNVNVTTIGASSSALATDFGGGNVTVTGGIISAAASHSAGIYSTGNIVVTGASISATGDNGAVIDADGIISLINTSLSGAENGLMVHNTVGQLSLVGVFTINGGSIIGNGGDVFNIDGAKSTITVKGAASVSSSTGNIVNAFSSAVATFIADGESLSGNLICDNTSSIAATLQNNSTLTGSIDSASLTIDGTSKWHVTAVSWLRTLIDPSGISGSSITNIYGNGYNVYYNKLLSANSYLGGLTYSLVNGGNLLPIGTTGVDDQTTLTPKSFKLEQNYPNPFNPSTTINFSLPKANHVILSIYNSMGQEVAKLVSKDIIAGVYTAEWNATGFASGIYYYRIVAGGFIQTKKLILLK